jgi:iron complex transport system substrate-binding protein
LLSRKNFPSRQVSWSELVDFNPEKIVLMVCGFDIERTVAELEILHNHPIWNSLRAVQTDEVYIANGNSFFARPGPRIVDSLEMLAQTLHPELFDFQFPSTTIVNFKNILHPQFH